MTMVKLAEAAYMTRKAESTITRAAQSGKLSVSKDENGTRLFDPAELQRVYGKLRYPKEDMQHVQDEVQMTEHARADGGAHVRTRAGEKDEHARAMLHEERISALQDRVQSLQRQRDRAIEETESWKEQAAAWQKHADKSLYMLSDQREKTTLAEEPDINLSETTEPQKHPKRWPYAVAAALFAAVAVGAVLYPDITREKFDLLTKSFTSETVATVSE